TRHAGRFAQGGQGLHNGLERREQRHRVERAVFETRLLERDVEHLEPVHLSRMRERPRRELEADSVPAPLARERKEEPERAADVEDAAAVRLERIEHLGELAPVELLLPRRREDVEPEIVGRRGPVLLEHDGLLEPRIDEHEPAVAAADECETVLLEETRVCSRAAERAVDLAQGGPPYPERLQLTLALLEIAVAA